MIEGDKSDFLDDLIINDSFISDTEEEKEKEKEKEKNIKKKEMNKIKNKGNTNGSLNYFLIIAIIIAVVFFLKFFGKEYTIIILLGIIVYNSILIIYKLSNLSK